MNKADVRDDAHDDLYNTFVLHLYELGFNPALQQNKHIYKESDGNRLND